MIKSNKLKTPLYHCSFSIIIYENDTELQNKFKNYHFEPSLESFDGGVFEVDNHFFLALKSYKENNIEYPTFGIVAHESKHLVNKVFAYIRQELDVFNDEAECYFLEWVVDKCHKCLNEFHD